MTSAQALHRTAVNALTAAALAGVASLASAHDSWFERASATELKLGTGNQFPGYEVGIGAQYLVRQGCQAAGSDAQRPPGTPVKSVPVTPMKALRNDPLTLALGIPADATTCWAQLAPFEVEIQPDKIALYLQEINAGPELRSIWAGLHARGLPWKERYTKHARIVLAPGAALPPAAPDAMGMDALIDRAADSGSPGDSAAAEMPKAGRPLRFRVYRDGRPLAGLPVELRSDFSRFGIWRRTDAEGRISVTGLPAGNWILRGVDLHLSTAVPDTWESRFFTLAFTVQ